MGKSKDVGWIVWWTKATRNNCKRSTLSLMARLPNCWHRELTWCQSIFRSWLHDSIWEHHIYLVGFMEPWAGPPRFSRAFGAPSRSRKSLHTLTHVGWRTHIMPNKKHSYFLKGSLLEDQNRWKVKTDQNWSKIQVTYSIVNCSTPQG